MSETNFERRWRTVLWLMIGVVVVLLLATIWDYLRWRHGQDGDAIEWRRGTEVRRDSDGDGRIDEVRYQMRNNTNDFLVKRDTTGDGVLNMRYILRDGIAVEITDIKEAVGKP